MSKGKHPNSLKNLWQTNRLVPEGMARKAVGFKLPKGQYEIWMSLPTEERNQHLREAVKKILVEKNMLPMQ